MSTILLTYGTRPIAQRIAKVLDPHHHIILATNEEIPSVLAQKYKSIPNPANPVFAHEMLKLCLDQAIDIILPLGAAEIQVLSASNILFEEYGITILHPSLAEQRLVAQTFPPDTGLQIVKNGQSLVDEMPSIDGLKNGVYAFINEAWLPVII